jgi:DNA polymerase elongation subunit (family B)
LELRLVFVARPDQYEATPRAETCNLVPGFQEQVYALAGQHSSYEDHHFIVQGYSEAFAKGSLLLR